MQTSRRNPSHPPEKAGMARHGARYGAQCLWRWLLCGAGALAVCLGGWKSLHAGERILDERQKYADQVSQTYSYRFGKGEPFLPSNAKIQGDTFIQPGAFPTAQYCRHCHEASYHQWRQSLHANSFRTPFYTKNVGLLQNTKGMEFSRHCEGCHNPIELFSGQVTPQPTSKDREFDQDGVTCMVCHSIQKLQPTYGLGSYVMGVPAVMVDEQGKPIPGEVSYAEINAHVDRHKAAVMKDFYRTPEYCASCHKANIPETLNDYKWLRAIGLYDEWQQSSYAKQSPLPFYKKDMQTCQSCHMTREQAVQADVAAKNGTIVSHRWVGGNTAVPFLYGYDEQLKKTLEYLKADKLNVDLFALAKPDGSGLIAPLGAKSFDLKPGDELQAMVVIQNKGVGHTLIPEQRDMYQAWAEFELSDADGKVLHASGRLSGDGTLDPEAHSFITRLLDKDGGLLTKHEIWQRRTTATDATIRPGRSTLVRYGFRIPKDGKGPYTLTAKVNYRHFNEAFTDFALGAKHPAYPVAEMAVRTRVLKVGENATAGAEAKDNLEWMRWNNFGIALLDQAQYAEAKDAFTEVLKLRPDYGDAYTNLGVVYLQWERYADAAESLKKALAMMPGDARALYYNALVERNQGDLDGAVADLQHVVSQFPHSPDAHRELGFSYYQQHKYGLARVEYETVQGIEPDDLAAHYNLAIIYRREGDKQKAAAQAALFADEKDDPMASTATLGFLRQHPELSGESVPWHLHTADETAATAKK
jgi:tetratricopeptide (TPR) repeat protein